MRRGTVETDKGARSNGRSGSHRASHPARARNAAIGVTGAALLAVGGLTASQLLGSAHPVASARPVVRPSVTGQSSASDLDVAASQMPQLVGTPGIAAMPASAKPAEKPSPSASPSSSSPTASASATAPASSGGGGGGGTTAAPPAGSSTCADPQYTTSDPTAMWNQDPYFVANDMWGISGYSVSQTLSACSPSNWYVTATMNNDNGDGHVKTFPNSHRDFDSEPAISSFSSITSTFAETDPGAGIYEDAYDIWLNGIGTDGSTELMIWTSNHGQTPSGSVVGTTAIDGRSYTVWKSGTYIAFVATSSFSSATMNLKDFFQYLMGQGWLASGATLGQVDYGVELVSTDNAPEKFTFSNFTVNAS
jgi:Glycosyl hydrolase family 12